MINGLRPFMPVVVVGDRTYGKPVGQYGLPFCDKVLAPVAFAMVNANGQGDYFAGLPADCPAADDVEPRAGRRRRGLAGRSAAGSSAPARCSAATPALGTRRCRGRRHDPPRATGWASLVNAH